MKQTSFSFKFFAEGIKNSSISAGNTSTCDSKMSALVRGPEPGYVATPICVVQSAFVVLDEIAKFPVQGGVLSPGAVFYNTSLIDRLDKEGVSFRVLSTE